MFKIRASLNICPAAEEGRSTPFPDRKHKCILGIGCDLESSRNFSVQVHFDTFPVSLGDSVNATIEFACPELAAQHLSEGTAFFLRESRAIAAGVVLEVVDQ